MVRSLSAFASVLLLEEPEGLSEEARRERWQFVQKFQQFTGPVTGVRNVQVTAM